MRPYLQLNKLHKAGKKISPKELADLLFDIKPEKSKISYMFEIMRTFLSFDFLFFRKDISAILFPNDLFARSAIQSLSKIGIQVPRNISVISFDNIPIEVPIFFNTVDPGLEELGYQAIHALLGDVPVIEMVISQY